MGVTNSYKKNWIKLFKAGYKFPFDEFINIHISYIIYNDLATSANRTNLIMNIYNSYLSALIGPYSYLMDLSGYKRRSESLYFEYSGFGMTMMPHPKGQKVITVFKGNNSPLKKGDIITHLKNQESLVFTSLEKMKKKMISVALNSDINSYKIFRILRDGKTLEVRMRYQNIRIPSLEIDNLKRNGKVYKVIKLRKFYSTGFCSEIYRQVNNAKNMSGIILDLRDNGGGALNSAKCLASAFLDEHTKMWTLKELSSDLREPKRFSKSVVTYSKNKANIKTPLIILMNRNSASASELVASTLQDAHRGIVVGEVSFGKGLGQKAVKNHIEVPYLSKNENMQLYFTKFLIYRKKGYALHVNGVVPNIFLKFADTTANDINKKTYWENLLERFSWKYIFDFSIYQKWSFAKSDKTKNLRIKKCFHKINTKEMIDPSSDLLDLFRCYKI